MNFKKILVKVIAFVTMVSIALCGGINGSAETIDVLLQEPDIKEVLKVPTENLPNSKTKAFTNLGGISVGTANNRLYVVKANNEEKFGVLYYYSDIYSKKEPKKVVFDNYLLGHANAMAIDDDYVYVTRWQNKKNGEKSKILKISREAIRRMSNGFTVKNIADKVGNIRICYDITPKFSDGKTKYNRSINAITTYSRGENETKFIIKYDTNKNKSKIKFVFATLKGNNFIVNIDKSLKDESKNVYIVDNPTASEYYEPDGYEFSESCTMQDIFYNKSYGLFIPIWHPIGGSSDTKYNQTQNSILQVDIKNSKPNTVIKPKNIINIDVWFDYDKFELESLAFVTKKSDRKTSTFRFIMSCNVMNNSAKQDDAIFEIKNPEKFIKKI